MDRVLSLDLLALTAGGLLAVHDVRSNEPVFLDAILILSIIAFLGTIVFARFIEGDAEQIRGEKKEEVISSLCLLSGSLFIFISVLGILKFPDVFIRMHSAAKDSSLGVSLILIGVILHFILWMAN